MKGGSFAIAPLVALAALLASCQTGRSTYPTPQLPLTMAEPVAAVKEHRQQAVESLYLSSDPKKAERSARAALALDPWDSESHEVLAGLARLSDDPDQCFHHLTMALADPRSHLGEQYIPILLSLPLTKGQREALSDLLSQVERDHPYPPTRAAALAALPGLLLDLGESDQAQEALERRHLIKDFMAIGGFENDQLKGFDTPYPPELKIDLEATYEGQHGTARWGKAREFTRSGKVDLAASFYPFSWNVAFLHTSLLAPQEMDVVLEMGSSDPVKVWLNDGLVVSDREVRFFQQRQIRVAVHLNKGWNKVLVKTCQGAENWVISLGLADQDGRPLAVKTSAQPQPYTPLREVEHPWEIRNIVTEPIRSMAQSARRDFWIVKALNQSGHVREALRAVDALVQHSQGNPLLMMEAIKLHQKEGEAQRTVALLNKGCEMEPPYSRLFWVWRSSLFREKKQYDKAFDALKMVALPLGSTVQGATELAGLLGDKRWYEDQCQLADQWMKKRPGWTMPYELKAECLTSLGRPKEAIEPLRQALELLPLNSRLSTELASTHLNLGECSEAVDLMKDMLSQWTNLRSARLKLGHMLRQCGRLDEALAVYGEAAQRVPLWDEPAKYSGQIHYERGQKDKALESWRQALASNPKDAWLWDRVEYLNPQQDPVLSEHQGEAKDLDRWIKLAQETEPEDGASSILALDHEVTRVMPDGSVKRLVTIVARAVDKRGRDELGSFSLPAGGHVKVVEAFAVDTNGDKREVTSMRDRKLTFPEVHEDTVIVIQYRHYHGPPPFLRPHFANSWRLQQAYAQVLLSEWVLALPANQNLKVKLQGEVDHRVETKGDMQIHRFLARNVSPLSPEDNTPPLLDLLRSVVVSTVPDWSYFSAWSESLTAEVFEVDQAQLKVIQTVTGQARTAQEKLDALTHFVQTKIRYQQDYENVIARVRPHRAPEVLSRGYGDCKDKSVLLISMLREVGIRSSFSLVRTRGLGKTQVDVPYQQFNHAVVYVPAQEGIAATFIDTTAESLDMNTLRPDVQGTQALVLDPKGYRFLDVPYDPPERNRSRFTVNMKLHGDGSAKAEVSTSLVGHLASKLRKPMQNRDVAKKVMEQMVHQMFSGATFEEFQISGQDDVTKPLSLELECQAPQAARPEGKALRVAPPDQFDAITSLGKWTERKLPLMVGVPTSLEYAIAIDLPAGSRVKRIPEPLHLEGACFVFDGKWTQEGNERARFDVTFSNTCAIVETEAYPAFRKEIHRIKRWLKEEMVLEKGKARKAPALGGRPAQAKVAR